MYPFKIIQLIHFLEFIIFQKYIICIVTLSFILNKLVQIITIHMIINNDNANVTVMQTNNSRIL